MESLLKDLKNKIVEVEYQHILNQMPNFSEEVLILEDYDNRWVKFRNSGNQVVYANIDFIYNIIKACKDNQKKFLDYQKKYRKNKNFAGDLGLAEKEEVAYLG